MKSSISALAGLAAILLLPTLPIRSFHAEGIHAATGNEERTPVLVELFTSEGCSSCPPADEFLQELDRSQPVPGAEAIVLSEHVDYWDSLGWRDPYSSHEFTERQNAYAERFRLDSVYTPQMVVNGQSEMVGSNEGEATRAIAKAITSENVPIVLSGVRRDGHTVVAHIEAGPQPGLASAQSVTVFVALADDNDHSSVRGGENGGRELTHVNVLRSLNRIGTVSLSNQFSRDVKLDFSNGNGGASRMIVFLQEGAAGKVLGAASANIAP